jgi:hypothetical protein
MNSQSTQALLNAQLKTYPLAQLEDIYKVLHQAIFGVRHSPEQKKGVAEWLAHEWQLPSSLKPGPLAEALGPDWLRLHLRPYQAQGGQMAPLLDCLLDGAQARGDDAAGMQAAWEVWREMAHKKSLIERFPPRQVDLFGQAFARRGWAASPHSAEYIRHYQPCYRVLRQSLAQQLCAAQGLGLEIAR